MIDLRKEFANTLHKYGHWVILRQALVDKKCSCIDSTTGEPRRECSRCNGSGYSYIDHILLSRRTKLIDSIEMTTDLGLAAAPRWHFYMMYKTKPNNIDWIIEIALDPITRDPITPIKIEKYYDIQDVETMRGDDGKVIYFDCQTEESIWNVLSE